MVSGSTAVIESRRGKVMEQSTPKTGIIPPSRNDGDLIAPIFENIGRILYALGETIFKALETADRDYNRGARLRALQRRHQWKQADKPRLLALGISPRSIEQRIGAKRLGRPVVSGYKSLAEALDLLSAQVMTLDDVRTEPHERLRILKRLSIWPFVVEALYRGERERAKAVEAENIIGDALHMSPEAVHKLCGKVRRDRKKGIAPPDCPAMTVAEFKEWMRSGKHPDDQF
jgi:hypothetical protein